MNVSYPGNAFMSSYDSPEESEDGSSHDPGVKEGEITEDRELSGAIADLDRSDYIVIGMLLSLPAGLLTAFLLSMLFPEFHETAGEVVRWIGKWSSDHLLMQEIVSAEILNIG
jgi:hypothetical protein